MSLNIVLSYENAAPQAFQQGMQQAANILDSLILNNLMVNIHVTYDASLGTGAESGDIYGPVDSYSTLRAALASHGMLPPGKGQPRSQPLSKRRG